MDTVARTVEALPFHPDDWAPFGWVPMDDSDPRDGESRLVFEWQDVHLNVIGHSLDELVKLPDGLRCDAMFRHATHTQALMVLNCDALVAVAPPGAVFEGPADLNDVRAFLLEPLVPFVLHQSTWHWGPFPLGPEPVRLLNVQGLRYAEDNDMVDLAAAGLSFGVKVALATV